MTTGFWLESVYVRFGLEEVSLLSPRTSVTLPVVYKTSLLAHCPAKGMPHSTDIGMQATKRISRLDQKFEAA